MASSPLLLLPLELRNSIYEYVLLHPPEPDDDIEQSTSERRPKRITTRNDRWQWTMQYTSSPPTANYYNILRVNRQLHHEIKDFLRLQQALHGPQPAHITLLIDNPNITPSHISLPQTPTNTTTLDLLVKVAQMYHPVYISRPPHNTLLLAIFEVLKTYFHRGPHLARPTPLSQKLHLEKVRITIAPPQPLEEMTYVYGFPQGQLETLFEDFDWYLKKFARSGLAWGDVEGIEYRLMAKEWRSVGVRSDVWDEGDYVFFKDGGYRWSDGMTGPWESEGLRLTV
ncbi:uncharacterized protein LTR77_002690 [Saxophila tyrrhenica]|uniref:Uncharacterized protein n=1 Tax=Saxophila tyrrhenica TaxID=1690608 RepID=A0AAV9PG69_9PEZI|nr:hypothetical protein LTR77_002690 [Saxophila tyrrhenica]